MHYETIRNADGFFCAFLIYIFNLKKTNVKSLSFFFKLRKNKQKAWYNFLTE